jgi:hypothetical protein
MRIASALCTPLASRLAWAMMLGQGLFSETRIVQGASLVAKYKMVYGDDENVAEETLDGITTVESEDGWIVLFRGDDAILRVQDRHVQSLELVTA